MAEAGGAAPPSSLQPLQIEGAQRPWDLGPFTLDEDEEPLLAAQPPATSGWAEPAAGTAAAAGRDGLKRRTASRFQLLTEGDDSFSWASYKHEAGRCACKRAVLCSACLFSCSDVPHRRRYYCCASFEQPPEGSPASCHAHPRTILMPAAGSLPWLCLWRSASFLCSCWDSSPLHLWGGSERSRWQWRCWPPPLAT